jgi:hypothetical protein
MFIKEIFLIICEYLDIKDQITFSRTDKTLYKIVRKKYDDIYFLANSIYKMKIKNTHQYETECGKKLLKIFKKYNTNKVVDIDYVFWCSFEKKIKELNYNEEIEGVHIEYMDRGVRDWKELDRLLKLKFPNLKSINTSQNFGGDNLEDSDCELIILDTNSEYEMDESNIIYQKIIRGPDNYCPNMIIINMIKIGKQIQIIVTGEDEEREYF